jgi:hypothetical protein
LIIFVNSCQIGKNAGRYTVSCIYRPDDLEVPQTVCTFIGLKEQVYADWGNDLLVMVRIDYLKSVLERNIAAVIWMLSHLQDLGKISITFTDHACLLYRNPYSLKEQET